MSESELTQVFDRLMLRPDDVNTAMLHIKALDPDASVRFSEWTGKWYVAADIDISDGAVIGGITEHRDGPERAVTDFLARLTQVGYDDLDHVLVTRANNNDRRHWRWNGAAFVIDSAWSSRRVPSVEGETQ